jgi:hypothetical protein
MTIHRRAFLRSLAGMFGAASIPDLRARVLDAGKPILLQPPSIGRTIYVSEYGGLFLGAHGLNDFVPVTWRDYFIDCGAWTEDDLQHRARDWEINDLDARIDDEHWPRVYEAHYDPMPAAYRFLKENKIGSALRARGGTAGRLDFFAGSNHPGSEDRWVEVADDLSVSLLQADLIERGLPISVEMESDTIVKQDDESRTPE